MKKNSVSLGSIYTAKVSGDVTMVQLTREHHLGGWYGVNLATGREIRIRTAARLRSEVKPAGEGQCDQIRKLRQGEFTPEAARQIIDGIRWGQVRPA